MADPSDDATVTPPDSKVTVTIADDHLGQTAAVADELRAAGMSVEQVLDTVGVITGSIPAPRRPSIEAVTGVAAVEEDTTFQLAPPDSEVQ